MTLDCRGMLCPLPVIKLAQAFPDLAIGDTITVLADDPAAATDIPAWCRMRGHDFLGETAAPDGVPVYSVRRRS